MTMDTDTPAPEYGSLAWLQGIRYGWPDCQPVPTASVDEIPFP